MYIIRETTERESDGLELSRQDTIISAPENRIDDIFHMYAIDARKRYYNAVSMGDSISSMSAINQLGFPLVSKVYCVYLIEYDGSEEGEIIDFASYGSIDFVEEARDEIRREIDDERLS